MKYEMSTLVFSQGIFKESLYSFKNGPKMNLDWSSKHLEDKAL